MSTPTSQMSITIQTLLRGGYHDPEAILAMAVEEACDDDESEQDHQAAAERAFDSALMALQAEQASWPAQTDNDRLAQAFAQLERDGIVCRENHTCCQTCGCAEIGEEMEAQTETGRQIHGYTFFHQQDTERAMDRGGLMLAYGAGPADDKTTLEVGRMVADALTQAGLEVNWSGESEQRIEVIMRWQKRWTRGERAGRVLH